MAILFSRRYLPVILFLSVITYGFSQKSYRFDYLLEYAVHDLKDSITLTKYSLTNSLDNSYKADVIKKNDSVYSVNFVDYNGVKSTFELDKTQFYSNNDVLIDVVPVEKTYKVRRMLKKVSFEMLQDTIIENTTLKHYKFYRRNKRKAKKSNCVERHFFVCSNNGFHLPIFDSAIAFDKWKSGNGVLPESMNRFKMNFDYNGNLITKEKLKKVSRIKKYFIVDQSIVFNGN